MKKTAKSGAGKTRHSKSAKKPVTIDLKAESVKTNPKPETAVTAKPATRSKSRTRSVPKVDSKAKTPANKSTSQSAKAATATAATSSKGKVETKPVSQSSTKSISKSASNFGRDAKGSSVDEKKQTASKDQPIKEPAKSSTPPPAPAKEPSQWPGRLVAGIVGGVIVLSGSTVINGLGSGSSDSGDYVSSGTLDATKKDLAKRIAALESQLKDPKSGPAVDMSAIDAKINETATATQTKLDEVTTQISSTDEKLGALEAKIETANEKLANVDMAAVGEKAAAVSSQIEKVSSQAETIDKRIASLEDIAESRKPAPETAAAIKALQAAVPEISTSLTKQFDEKLNTISEKLSSVEQKQEALPKLTENVATIETGVTELKNGLEAVQKQGEAQQSVLASLQEETRSIAEAEKKAAGSVAAAALKNDIDNGQPFENSLKNLEAFAGQSKDITGLAPFSKSGVPTAAMLQKEFSQLSDKIIQATKPKPTGDLSERLLSSARSFIKAKPIKKVDGSGAEAIVSQISANLTSGDITKASELWATLPETGQAVSKEWHDRLQARVTADSLLSNAVQSFLNSTVSQ